MVAAFVQRLRELGWIEGRTVAIEYRWAEGTPSASPRSLPSSSGSRSMSLSRVATASIARSKAGDIGRSRSSSRRRGTRSAPASSPAWRDRAATSPACRSSQPILPAKRLELLREVVPVSRRLAILANVGNPVTVLEMDEVQAAARTLGLEVVP